MAKKNKQKQKTTKFNPDTTQHRPSPLLMNSPSKSPNNQEGKYGNPKAFPRVTTRYKNRLSEITTNI